MSTVSSYTQLVALSKAQTKASDAAAQLVLAERERKLEAQRKEQEAREKREKDIEARMRKKQLEDQAREEERRQRKEQEREAREREMARKEAEHRDQLLHGPKRSSGKREGGGGERGHHHKSNRNSESPEPQGAVLTREELRQQKRTAEMKKIYSGSSSNSPRRSQPASFRARSHLRGGAVPIVTSSPGLPVTADSGHPGQSIKERISAVPLTLTKLNIVKRDLRTIDEILIDRDKARKGEGTKVIAGEEAKEFSDWFSKGKKKASSVGTPPPYTSEDSQRSNGATPLSAPSSARQSPVPRSTSNKPQRQSLPSMRASASASSSSRPSTSQLDRTKLRHSASSVSPMPSMKKRPRSPSVSPEPPALKKRKQPPPPQSNRKSYLPDDVLSLFSRGRERRTYDDDNLFSDESDMEAGASDQEREERYSERVAKREDAAALAEQQRHDEEKRRRKAQKLRE